MLGQHVRGVALAGADVRYRPGDARSLWCSLVVALAGPTAEQRLCGYSEKERRELWKTCWSVDLRNAQQRVAALGGDDRYWPRAFAQAAALVNERWDAILAIAPAIAQGEGLSGVTIDKLIGRRTIVKNSV